MPELCPRDPARSAHHPSGTRASHARERITDIPTHCFSPKSQVKYLDKWIELERSSRACTAKQTFFGGAGI